MRVKLFDNGVIEYHYAGMTNGTATNYAGGAYSTVWLDKPGLGDSGEALTIGVNSPVISSNTAYRFIPR